jgi:hypothetical protein
MDVQHCSGHRWFLKMDHQSKTALRTFPPRPLTEDERHVLLDWIKAAKGFSAFVSERRSDDPEIYRRIVVSRRATKQHLYLIHSPTDSARWIVFSAAKGEYVERFPTLRTALNYIEPVSLPIRVAEASSVQTDPATRRKRPLRHALASTRVRVVCWACALAAMLMVSRWLSWDGSVADGSRNAEAIAEQVVRDSVSDPDSTQFRNVMAYRVGFDNERWVCGWFNARNTGGEFFGYRRFVVHVLLTDRRSPDENSNIRTHLLLSETEVPGMTYAWENYCR